MCGRFNLTAPPEKLAKQFNLPTPPEYRVDYNINPGGAILAIKPDGKAERLHWGLIPFWAKEKKIAYNLINARLETVAEKPSFREAFKKRHVIIPATGYYEWQPQASGGKQAFHITLPDHAAFGVAGLLEHWQKDDEMIESCTIITTSANDRMRAVHSRMPVILAPDRYAQWLDTAQSKTAMLELLADDSAYDGIETLPRAWGRPIDERCVNFAVRNTPTGVGKTNPVNHHQILSH